LGRNAGSTEQQDGKQAGEFHAANRNSWIGNWEGVAREFFTTEVTEVCAEGAEKGIF